VASEERTLAVVRGSARAIRHHEAAGVVLAAGPAVNDWAPGDAAITRPVPLRVQGTWSPRLLAPAEPLARKPHSTTWEAAAAFPVLALTAEQVVRAALNIQAG
jgi:NADPH:quinone reductase-like Zn-dependent oxidoreductase